MTIATSDKYIWVPVENGKTVAIKYVAPITSEKFVYLPDSIGRSIAQKYTAPTGGNKYLNLPVNGGGYVALGLDASVPKTFEKLDNGTWQGRGNHCMCTFSDEDAILFGGFSTLITNYLYDGWITTDRGETWSQKTTAEYWSARQSAASVVLSDNSILIIGGSGAVNYNDTYHTTDKGSSWHVHSTGAGWTARYGHGVVRISDNNILMLGGYAGAYKNDIWHSTDQGSSWHNVTSSAEWSKRQNVYPQLIGNTIIIGGGYGSSGYLQDSWVSTDDGASWQQTTTSIGWSVPNTLPYCSCVAGGYMHLFGHGVIWSTAIGASVRYNDVLVTNDGETWVNTSLDWGSSTDYRTSFASAGWGDGDYILTGGTRDTIVYLNEVWRYA